MRVLLLVVAALFFGLVAPQTAQAHTLLMDDSKIKGAMLHIIPDDNPVAGQPSTLLLDIQGANIAEGTVATLTVGSDEGQSQVQARLKDSLASFEYTFPAQGVYSLTFSVPGSEQVHSFTMSWRVSRGITSGALDTPRYAWAEITLLTSAILFILMITIMLGRWRLVEQQSTL